MIWKMVSKQSFVGNACVRNGSGGGGGAGRSAREVPEAVSDGRPLTQCQGPWARPRQPQRADRVWGRNAWALPWAQVHLRNLDSVRLLEEPGCLVIDISHQDHDFLCHLGRGKWDRNWGSEAFWVIKGQWPLVPKVYVSTHLPPSLYSPSLLPSFFYSFMQHYY